MNQTVTISPLQPEDLPKIAELFRDLHHRHVKGRPDIYAPSQSPVSEEELSILSASEDYLTVAARFQAEVVGFAVARKKVTPDNALLVKNRSVYIEDLYVVPDFRNRGVGGMLYEEVERFAKANGISRLELNVWAFNEEAVRFYQKRGMDVQRYVLEKSL